MGELAVELMVGQGAIGAVGAWFVELLVAFWGILVDAGPWLLVGFMVAGVLHTVVPMTWLSSQFGSGGIGSVVKATLLGVPMPLCSCSVIPAAAGLRRGGASKGASASFAITTPEVDVPAASLTWAMLGWPIALVRIAAAMVSGLAAGVAIDALGERESTPAAEPVKSCCCHSTPTCCSSSAEPAKPGIASRAWSSFKYGFVELPNDLSKWMVIGLLLSAVVAVFVPEDLIESVGTGWPAMLAMLVIGVPFYVCATASTPLAAVLVAKGLDPGAAVVFLLAGPATNPATMAWVLKDLGARSLAVYLTSISVVALGAGAAVGALGGVIDIAGMVRVSGGAHEHGDGWLSIVSGALLAVVLGRSVVVGAFSGVSKRLRAAEHTDSGSDPKPDPEVASKLPAESGPISLGISVDR